MDRIKAEWCRRFVESLLVAGVTDVGAAVRLAQATYPSASMLSPERAVWLLHDAKGRFLESPDAEGGEVGAP